MHSEVLSVLPKGLPISVVTRLVPHVQDFLSRDSLLALSTSVRRYMVRVQAASKLQTVPWYSSTWQPLTDARRQEARAVFSSTHNHALRTVVRENVSCIYAHLNVEC